MVVPCNQCKRTSRRYPEYNYHLRKVHGRFVTLKCGVCSYEEEKRIVMLDHYKQLHKKELIQVDFLGYTLAGPRYQDKKEREEKTRKEKQEKERTNQEREARKEKKREGKRSRTKTSKRGGTEDNTEGSRGGEDREREVDRTEGKGGERSREKGGERNTEASGW